MEGDDEAGVTVSCWCRRAVLDPCICRRAEVGALWVAVGSQEWGGREEPCTPPCNSFQPRKFCQAHLKLSSAVLSPEFVTHFADRGDTC